MQTLDNGHQDIKTIAEFECDQADLLQRQRIFEDVIIQRIKVIQEFVRRQSAKSKLEQNLVQTESLTPRKKLGSVETESKIEEVVKWRLEAYTRKMNERLMENEQKTSFV